MVEDASEVVYESVKELGPSGELLTGSNVGQLSLHEQGPAALENRCAYLDMIRSQIYQNITTQVFCYYAGVSDDQP